MEIPKSRDYKKSPGLKTLAYGPRLYSNIKLYVNSPHSLVHLLQIQLIARKNIPTVIISMG